MIVTNVDKRKSKHHKLEDIFTGVVVRWTARRIEVGKTHTLFVTSCENKGKHGILVYYNQDIAKQTMQ